MACYRSGGCGPYEMYSCSECPASKPEYAQTPSTCSKKEQIRLIDAAALKEELSSLSVIITGLRSGKGVLSEFMEEYRKSILRIIDEQATIDPESLRPQGEWVWKHRHHGGFRRYTGVDDFGNTHTITVDERCECDEPYCPNCGKWNESVFLNYCPNCGAKMKGGTP